jgi:hypothetical protein
VYSTHAACEAFNALMTISARSGAMVSLFLIASTVF